MKSEIHKISESELLDNYPIRGTVDGWFFRTKETSSNAWEVEGSDKFGRKVYFRGDDPDILLEKAEMEVRRISSEVIDT